MAEDIPFDRSAPQPGHLEQVSERIRRWVMPNGGPFTFTGTCVYVLGRGKVAILDPGTGLAGEIEALLAALPGETVENIVVTHTHRDHSPGARHLQHLTGAPISGCGQHIAARPMNLGERNILDASADHEHRPDQELHDGDVLAGTGYRLTALATPGHTMNHLCFAFAEENALMSGDHVMAWSTSIVAPPDGSMSAYMSSLEKLRKRKERVFWPGHGGPVTNPQQFVRALIGHRRMREATILAELRRSEDTIASIVEKLYVGLAPQLKGAAGLSVYAHLEDLVQRGMVSCDGLPGLETIYRA